MHLEDIFTYSKYDFWRLISLHLVQYFFVTHWQRFFRRSHISHIRCFVQWPLWSLAFLHESYFRPFIHKVHVLKDWHVLHFSFSHSNHTPLNGHDPRSTKTAWIPFWTWNDWQVVGLICNSHICYAITSPSGVVYHPSRKKACWPPKPLFIFATWSASFA